MAELQGLHVPSKIVPFTSEDTYPTHMDIYGYGGLRVVDTIAERDSITYFRQRKGMMVRVLETGKVYSLIDIAEVLTPDSWEFFVPDQSVQWETSAAVTATHADVILTNNNVILTHADALATSGDRIQVALDKIAITQMSETVTENVIITGNDVETTNQNVIISNLAALSISGNSDIVALNKAHVDISAMVASGNAIQTAADRVQTGLDRIQTGLDVVTITNIGNQTTVNSMAATAAASSALTYKQSVESINTALMSVSASGSRELQNSEAFNSILSNIGQTASCSLILPLAVGGMNFLMVVGQAGTYPWKIIANQFNKMYLNGTEVSSNSYIGISAPTIGAYISAFAFKTGPLDVDWSWNIIVGLGNWNIL